MESFWVKFGAFGLTVLAAKAIGGSLAIECYGCDVMVGEEGSCGQDPFSGVTTPNVSTHEGNGVCYVCFKHNFQLNISLILSLLFCVSLSISSYN